jgi:transposase
LNAIQPLAGFIYQEVELRRRQGQPQAIDIRLQPHKGMRGKCSQCQQPAPGYDRLEERSWLHVPLWGIPTYFFYAPRRVECPEHGIVVEEIPWSEGKRPVTQTMMGFLARWTRRLSWKQTAQVLSLLKIPYSPWRKSFQQNESKTQPAHGSIRVS